MTNSEQMRELMESLEIKEGFLPPMDEIVDIYQRLQNKEIDVIEALNLSYQRGTKGYITEDKDE